MTRTEKSLCVGSESLKKTWAWIETGLKQKGATEKIEDMKSINVAPDLHLIPLDLSLRGFTNFIGVWLYQGEKTVLIDVGPTVTVPHLLNVLDGLNADRLDAILLTHIHLDHAGGIGHIARAFPETPILCHEVGIPHLVDPSRLWEGSINTLGDTARAYGPIQPVPADQLVSARQSPWDAVVPIITPGHSPHHVSYHIAPYLFLGETGGVFRSLEGKHTYLRPATPPKFFLETAIESLDGLIALEPGTICYGHFGIRKDGLEMLQTHRGQLLLWERILGEAIDEHKEDDVFTACMAALFEEDPLLEGYFHMTPAEQERERFFLLNSIKGYAGYLQRKNATGKSR